MVFFFLFFVKLPRRDRERMGFGQEKRIEVSEVVPSLSCAGRAAAPVAWREKDFPAWLVSELLFTSRVTYSHPTVEGLLFSRSTQALLNILRLCVMSGQTLPVMALEISYHPLGTRLSFFRRF